MPGLADSSTMTASETAARAQAEAAVAAAKAEVEVATIEADLAIAKARALSHAAKEAQEAATLALQAKKKAKAKAIAAEAALGVFTCNDEPWESAQEPMGSPKETAYTAAESSPATEKSPRKGPNESEPSPGPVTASPKESPLLPAIAALVTKTGGKSMAECGNSNPNSSLARDLEVRNAAELVPTNRGRPDPPTGPLSPRNWGDYSPDDLAPSPGPDVESPGPVVESPGPVVESPRPVVESPPPVVESPGPGPPEGAPSYYYNHPPHYFGGYVPHHQQHRPPLYHLPGVHHRPMTYGHAIYPGPSRVANPKETSDIPANAVPITAVTRKSTSEHGTSNPEKVAESVPTNKRKAESAAEPPAPTKRPPTKRATRSANEWFQLLVEFDEANMTTQAFLNAKQLTDNNKYFELRYRQFKKGIIPRDTVTKRPTDEWNLLLAEFDESGMSVEEFIKTKQLTDSVNHFRTRYREFKSENNQTTDNTLPKQSESDLISLLTEFDQASMSAEEFLEAKQLTHSIKHFKALHSEFKKGNLQAAGDNSARGSKRPANEWIFLFTEFEQANMSTADFLKHKQLKDETHNFRARYRQFKKGIFPRSGNTVTARSEDEWNILLTAYDQQSISVEDFIKIKELPDSVNHFRTRYREFKKRRNTEA